MTKRKSEQLATRLGRNIATRRKNIGLTQEGLAERVGVDTETISRFERGATAPSLATLEVVATQLEITIADLLSEEAPEPVAEAQLVSTLMSRLKGKERGYLLELIRLYCRQHS